jgi:hypothetical protein
MRRLVQYVRVNFPTSSSPHLPKQNFCSGMAIGFMLVQLDPMQ